MLCEVIDVDLAPYSGAGSGVPRSSRPGEVHCTDVIRYIEEKLRRGGRGGFEDMELTMDIGFWWEEMLSRIYMERNIPFPERPGEFVCDGIVISPDGIGTDTVEPYPMALREYKATWQSSRKLPSDNWRYMTQAKSYCYVIGVNVVIYDIAYLMGNYQGSGPQYRQARVEFTNQELYQNWEMLKLHAKEMMETKDGRDSNREG